MPVAHPGKLAGRLFGVSVPVATAERSQRFVRGWVVLAGVFGVMMITSGFAFYGQGVFLTALVKEQGFPTWMAGLGTTVFLGCSGVLGYFTGNLISRFDVRWVLTIGAVVGAFGLGLLSEVRTWWQLVGVMLIFGIGFGLAGLVPTTTLVTRWFERRRSVALSIASTGLSIGGIVITRRMSSQIAADTLVYWAWRYALIYGVSILALTWLLLRAWPRDVGLLPDGASATSSSQSDDVPGTPFEQAVRTRFFILVSIGFVLVMGSQVGAIHHLHNLTDSRIGIEAAGAALALLAGTSVVARIGGGIAATKMPMRLLSGGLMVVQTAGLCLLALAGDWGLLLPGVLVLGAAMGNLLMLHPLILADAFGVKDYPRIYGFGSLLMVFGAATGPLFVGVLRDAYSYRLAFLAIALIAIVGLAVYSFSGNPARDYVRAPAPVPLPRVRSASLSDHRQPAIPPSVPAVAPGGAAAGRAAALAGAAANGLSTSAPQIQPRTAPEVWSVEPARMADAAP